MHKMTAEERADAVNEIRLLASIKHDNICRYHEVQILPKRRLSDTKAKSHCNVTLRAECQRHADGIANEQDAIGSPNRCCDIQHAASTCSHHLIDLLRTFIIRSRM